MRRQRIRFLLLGVLVSGLLGLSEEMKVLGADTVSSNIESSYGIATEGMDEILDYGEVNQALEKLFPQEKLDFGETVASIVKGDTKICAELVNQLVTDQISYAFRVNRENLIHLLILSVIGAVFLNFSQVFKNQQIGEMGFYILYMLLIALCLNAFQVSVDWVEEGVDHLLTFMKALCPIYFMAVTFARGSVTSAAFYSLALLLITVTEMVILKFLLPLVHIYIVVRFLNCLSKEDYLSKMAELLEMAASWTMKTLLACVVGLNIVQGLIAPAIDAVKRSAVTRGAEAIPGVGDAIGGTAEVVLGTAVLIKNGIGMAGAVICLIICLVPLVQVAVMTLLYKLAAAFVQPVSDKRMVEGIAGIGDGCQLLMRLIFTVCVLFLLTIAIVAATTGS